MGKVIGFAISALVIGLMVLVLLAGMTLMGLGPAGEQKRRHAEERFRVEIKEKQVKSALAIKTAEQLRPVKTAALGIGIMAVALLLAGGSYQAYEFLRLRRSLVWPNAHGIYPVVALDLGHGVKVVHDPNRQPVATTLYQRVAGGVNVIPLQIDGVEASVRQATAVQLARAAVSGDGGLTKEVQKATRKLLFDDKKPVRVRVAANDEHALNLLEDYYHGDDSGAPATITAND